ncbi:MAG: ferritin-like domain-containing protein, partial [Rhodospirillaceae bacterium]|nr:ferritin-like domain-containing protein [Rhodospirillaceae bacterium]
MKHWTLDDIEWEKFDSTKVDPDLLKVMKAASLVEKNGHDYGRYLQKVFDDDPEFSAAAIRWAAEEVQHGDALGRWSELADPSFNFEAAFEDFAANIKLPIDVGKSVRGSRVGELVAR